MTPPSFITNGDRLEQKLFFSSLPKKTENPLSEISEAGIKKQKEKKKKPTTAITLDDYVGSASTDWRGGFTVLRALVCYQCGLGSIPHCICELRSLVSYSAPKFHIWDFR